MLLAHSLIFLQSQQIKLKDVIFPPDVVRAHITLAFHRSSVKEIHREWQEAVLFSMNTSPFCDHSECMYILNTVQYSWWTKLQA